MRRGGQVDRRTVMRKLTVAFRKFPNAPKNRLRLHAEVEFAIKSFNYVCHDTNDTLIGQMK
jgi:hypothetical protein